MDYKASVKKALENYHSRQEKLARPKEKRINRKPEAELRKHMIAELKKAGFLVLSLESQAVYSERTGRYTSQQVKSGTSDLVLCDQSGLFVALELKAPGHLSGLKDHQREFLESVITRHAFGAVVDSLDRFYLIYRHFLSLKDPQERIDYLLSEFPKKRKPKDSGSLFD
jgi:hypothetical protein